MTFWRLNIVIYLSKSEIIRSKRSINTNTRMLEPHLKEGELALAAHIFHAREGISDNYKRNWI